jgi:L,D-transpeptidase ErfK/SrfK
MQLTAVVAVLFLTQVIGSEAQYVVQPKDSLTSVGARFGISPEGLAETNGLDLTAPLRIGQTLRVDNRHIVPAVQGAVIVINVPQRMLFRTEPDGQIQAFPVAAGRRGWKTPLGDFTVVNQEIDPTWDVPLSIQAEMRKEGKPVLKHVPPSPQNPLGKYWIGLSIPNLGIHGTNAPASIYSLVTHGCVRLHPEDIDNLFRQVEIGTSVRIIYEPVLIVRQDDSILLEVHPDAYGTAQPPLSVVLDRARSGGYIDLLDLELVRDAIRKRDGVVRDVTKRSRPGAGSKH